MKQQSLEQEEFTKRFRSLRKQGETQVEFADRIGLSRPTIAQYENGLRKPDATMLIRICQKCGVSADWLLGLVPADVRTIETDIKTSCKTLNISEQSARNISETDLDGILSNRDLLCFVDALYKRFREHVEIAENEEPQTFPLLPKGYQIAAPGVVAMEMAHQIGASFERALVEELKKDDPDWWRKTSIGI